MQETKVRDPTVSKFSQLIVQVLKEMYTYLSLLMSVGAIALPPQCMVYASTRVGTPRTL